MDTKPRKKLTTLTGVNSLANFLNMANLTAQEVFSNFTQSDWVGNFHNGIGKSEGNTVSFVDQEFAKTHGFREVGLGTWVNESFLVALYWGDNKNAHHADWQVGAVFNSQGTLLAGKASVEGYPSEKVRAYFSRQ
jgi:hypothetical protein